MSAAAALEPSRSPPLLQVAALRKAFGEIEVLQGIDFELAPGEVHAILGENGAGKSTLVKCLAGFEPRSGGDLHLAPPDSPIPQAHSAQAWTHAAAERAGVVLIHQEFNLAEQLSVADNIFLGSEIRGPGNFFLKKGEMRSRSADYLAQLRCGIDPDTLVSELSVADKQMVEIAKTLAKKARVLILDEPTAVLTQNESAALFELIDTLRARGVGIIYISHKLEEIERLADRITIIRDGELVGRYAADKLSKDDMARLMVGRELDSLYPSIPKPGPKPGPALGAEHVPALAVSGLRVTGATNFAGEEFSVSSGEVLAFAGLVGSGRTALMETLLGLRPGPVSTQSAVKVHGKVVRLSSLADARRAGIAYLTKDRKGSGLLLDKSLRDNFSLLALDQFSRGVIDTRAEEAAFAEAVTRFDIRMRDTRVTAGKLSGGNQQKLLLAKVMASTPDVLIVDEPTRGIDIGTKSQIYHFLAQLAAAGKALILISSDMSEVIGMAHRVAVMHQGSIAGVLSGEEINEIEIMRYATGLKTAKPSSNGSES
jgi:ribose transport system ATP-binding protein